MRTASVRHSARAGVVAAAIIFLALAGCSASMAETESGGTDPVTGADLDRARDSYDLQLAQCLRDRGFSVQDPAPGQGITEFSPELQDAASDCADEIGAPPVTLNGADPEEILSASLEIAECFRERGFEVIEPKLGEVLVVPDDATEEDIAACDGLEGNE